MRCGPTEGIYLLHDLAPCNNSKNTRTFLEYKKNPVLEWPLYSPEINLIQDVWNIMKKDISNQKPCIKKICGSKYVKSGSV